MIDHPPGGATSRGERDWDRRRVEPASTTVVRTIGRGLKAGLVATVVMTAFRMPISHSPPPTANFWATYVAGGEPSDHLLVGLLLHLAYGTGAGVLFALLSPWRSTGATVESETRGVLRGLAFGGVLSAFGATVLLRWLLDMDLEPDERFIFHVSHAVYGLTLGAWYGSKAG